MNEIARAREMCWTPDLVDEHIVTGQKPEYNGKSSERT
jgi:hypothetical protein